MSTNTSDRSRPRPGRLRRLHAGLLFLVVSALCGVLAAGVAMPAVGAAVLGGKAAEGTLDDLPAAFDQPAQSQRSEVQDVNGDVLAYFYDENRVYVPLDEIAPVMKQAIISIEDHRFYEHGPLDAIGTLRAFLTNVVAGGVTQGGSTLTQQYVKMVQIEEAKKAGDEAGIQAAQDDSYGRKIKELRYAISVEKTLSKDEILERYLNIAYYGDGAYGIEVAAHHYFDTTADELTLAQAAMLAGLVQNPTANNPVEHPKAALQRRNVVLNRMAELGVITEAKAAKAAKSKFNEKSVTGTTNGCQGTDYPFVCDYVYRSLEQTASLGDSVEQRQETIKRGGLVVKTKFDPDTQDEIQDAVSSVVGPTDPTIAAMDMIEPGTGLIVAMAQSRPEMGDNTEKGETYWNYSVSPEMGGAQGFQAGSTFKAFTAAAALEQGIPLSKRYNAARTMDFSGRSFESCDGSSQVSNWRVSNSTGVNGTMDMYRAAEYSVNTYFVQLALDAGMCNVVQMAEKLGVESSTKDAPVSSYADKPSFTLGTVEVSPLSVAEAYATFASGGVHCDPIILESITDSTGAERAVPSANCQRVISEDVANAMSSLLSSVMTKGTGRRVMTADGRPQAGKTGTIDSNAAVWFVGYTPQVAGAAMISIDNTRSPFVQGKSGYRSAGLKGYTVPSTGRALEGSGSGDAGQEIWKPAMQTYLQGKAMQSFNAPPAELVAGRSLSEWRNGLPDPDGGNPTAPQNDEDDEDEGTPNGPR
ncbi:MAG TPA: transglycosylase domain-containing protein [Microlunatus sp.]|nr:transglycosylase domain-containing protein [Microlunatus sp.]